MAERRRWILIAAVLGSGIVFLDSTVVNVALPRIGRDLPRLFLGILEGQSYVYNAYLLTLSALLILAGALTDFYGRKRAFMFGLAAFGVTSVLCGVAPNMELLVLFRVLQGAAGAFLVPGSLALITANFEGEQQGRAFGVWAGASGATTILGPVVGGLLVDSISWRAAFLINVPLIAIALWATYVHVPESRDEEATPRFDWFGAAIVALAVGGLSFGAIFGAQRNWQDPVGYIGLA
ncbi:MAG: MFS transporter, partial [Chloroflexi bacterium]